VATSFLSGFPFDGLLTPMLLIIPLVLAFFPIYYVFLTLTSLSAR